MKMLISILNTIIACVLISFSLIGFAIAADNSVTIRGDKESPTVLYLVPWKKTPSSQGNTDFEMDMEFEFSPISRSEVVREVRYYKELGYDTKSVTKQQKDLKVIKR